MALLWIEGFRSIYNGSSDDWTLWVAKPGCTYDNDSGNYLGTYGRWEAPNNYAIYMGQANAIIKKFHKGQQELYCGAAMKKNEVGNPAYSASYPFFDFYDITATTRCVRFHVNADFSISAYNQAGTLLGTSDPGAFPDLQWCYFEAYVKLGTADGVVIVRINEQVVLNLTSKNTNTGAIASIGAIRFRSIYNTLTTYYTDMYADDAQFHGNCRVRSFVPDSDETHSDWTRNTGAADFECVDDIAAIDGDTTYIEAQALNAKSTFGITTGALDETVKGLAIENYFRAINSGKPKRIQALVRSGGADYQQPRSGAASTSYKFDVAVVEKDPQDGGDWNQTDIEAAEFGVKLTHLTTTTSTTTTTTTTVP